MRLSNAWILAFATLSSSISAFQLSSIAATATKRSSVSNINNIQATKTEELEDLYKVSSTTNTTKTNAADESHHTNGDSSMTYADINKLAYRALQKQCKTLDLIAVGTTSTLRGRLLDYYNLSRETNDIVVDVPKATAEEIEEICSTEGVTFCDESDPDFDFKSVLSEVMQKSSIGHWKAASRKLKKLQKNYSTSERPVPRDAYLAVLEACAANRLNGARASEPARKIIEDMATFNYEIPQELANICVVSSIGPGPGGTHDNCGGIDTALAMVAAIESTQEEGSESILTDASYSKLVSALAKDGAVEEAELVLRSMVVEKLFTPALGTFADVAKAAAQWDGHAEDVLQVLTYAKAAGYELDNIAAVETGRELLASGVIAAEKMDNLALGLRLLTAASKAEGCAPDTGDDLVASSSSAAQRASTLIHKRAIGKACDDNNWKLAVKLLELMPKRSLSPATSVWRRVLATCCKNEKSRKATAILLDWITLAGEGKAEKPPVSAFNTVVNTCEVCGEEELTVKVLDVMRDTLESEGNIVTFNIALKRLAKLGNTMGCEAILIGMLKEGLEPNVVSYTTAVGACAKEGMKNPAMASAWLERMRVRDVKPNFHTYNTALAACLDGKLESTFIASKIATEMIEDAEYEIACGLKGVADLKSALPDSYTKTLARKLRKQLRENWRSGDIDMALAKTTTRVPLLKLVDFDKTIDEARLKEIQCPVEDCDIDDPREECQDTVAEQSYEFDLLKEMHKDDHRTAIV